MKKIDKLFLKSFLGPFVLTTSVVVFIFLLRFLMMYFDYFIGKDLGIEVFGQLFSYFSLITVPTALPLAILLATLMTFGNLGEHTELTAIKSAGIPLKRMMLSTFVFTSIVSLFSYFYNDRITPWANLKGYSLLWDVKTTKMTLNIQEGIFYKEIPGYRIKVQKKYPNQRALKNVTVYDHTNSTGNKSVTLADSGEMYTINNANYLVFELFNGRNYIEATSPTNTINETQFTKNKFKKNKMVFSLESFGIKRTDEDQFKYHEYMKNTKELTAKIDTAKKELNRSKKEHLQNLKNQNSYIFRPFYNQEAKILEKIEPGPWIQKKLIDFKKPTQEREILDYTKNRLSSIQTQLDTDMELDKSKLKEIWRADLERWHKLTMAFACMVMFVIGASLGSIIKKGGFGMPVLVSVSFFIFYYVLIQLSDKYAKEGIISVILGAWLPCIILSIIGVFLALKASNDQSILESESFDKLKDKLLIYVSKFKKSELKT